MRSRRAAVAQQSEEPYLTMVQVLPLLPRKFTPGTPLRWAREGVPCRNGTRVVLKHIRLDHRILTTRTWLREFFSQQAEANSAPRQTPTSPSPAMPVWTPKQTLGGLRIPTHEEAEANLRARGILPPLREDGEKRLKKSGA